MSARKKNSLNRQVRRAYRQDQLARICTLPESKFGSAFGMQTTEVPQRARWWDKDAPKDAQNDYYHFRDNGASVLAVAHLDTVVPQQGRTPHFSATQAGPLIRGGALDDRLGAYVILGLLPKLGVTCDWLLTVGEERCQSTARYFEPEKDYDHVIEFDRMGTDVVMYQFEDEDSKRLVRASGAAMGHGSFSDIAELEHLNIKAFNWGVGYRGNYHSEGGYAYLYDTFAMVAKYLRFHAQNAGVALPHTGWSPSFGDYYRSGTTLDDGRVDCELCGAFASVSPNTGICAECDCCENCSMSADDCFCYIRHELSRKPVGQLTAPDEDDDGDVSKPADAQWWARQLAREKLEEIDAEADRLELDELDAEDAERAAEEEEAERAADRVAARLSGDDTIGSDDDVVSILAEKLG